MGLWGSKLQQCVTQGSSDGYYQTMDSSSSSDTPIEGGSRKLEPEWLERFLKRTFFDPCSEHSSRRNELNKYCIDCDEALCQYCLSVAPHEGHRLLKIYRHVYKDVVPLDEFERHIDCSQIQPYRCNKQLVIAATPLPHSGTKTIDDEETCQTCKRKLMKYELFSYCSLSCKVKAFLRKEDEDSPPFLSLDLVVQNSNEGAEPKNTTVVQPVPNSNQEALKATTIDQQAPNANQEPELESELKKTVDQAVENANQEAELESELKKRTVDQPAENSNQEPAVNKRTRRRKGIPHRAPFF